MTEQEWLQATDPRPMLRFLRGKTSDRKFRLFSVACCRSIWPLIADDRCRKVVERSERYADGNATEGEVIVTADQLYDLVYANHWAGCYAFNPNLDCVYEAEGDATFECHLVDDIFGPLPFRSITINPSWRTWHDGLLVSMAQQMYDSRDFMDLPILADALEEAGCSDADILGHCRGPGPHVRGCWVVDAILGKT